jgi:hypothetical protein
MHAGLSNAFAPAALSVCNAGSYMVGSACEACSPDCATCDPTSGACTACTDLVKELSGGLCGEWRK